MKITGSKKPSLTEARLRTIEHRYDFKFPAQYRKFLLEHNGGRPSPNRFRFRTESSTSEDSRVDWFLAVYEGENSNLEKYIEWYKVDEKRIPSEMISIARDPAGNLILISVRGDNSGAVYFWDHEREQDPSLGPEPTYDNVHLIAPSFSEFLDQLE
jgi:hypothetical protein